MTEAKTRVRFLWHAHPLWALSETWVLGLSILFFLSRVIGHVSPTVFFNGTLMLCGACGMWMVLRTRVPQARVLHQVLWESGVGSALSLIMVVGLRLSTDLLGWSDVWGQSGLDDALTTVLLLLTGAGYLVARVGVRLWHLWDRLRRRRMVLSLTHALLTLAVLLMALFVVLMATGVVLSGDLGPRQSESGGVIALIADRVFLTFMPLASVWAVMMVIVLVVLLPPTAVFSYFVARRTTRRLEMLAATARALRQGDYAARVEVAGEDEMAQLQADFNAMAQDLGAILRDLQVQRDTVTHLLQSRRELVASVSHELRTPVATIRAALESALNRGEGTLSPQLRHDLDVTEGEVLRLQRLIDDLFTLSQAEVEKLALECHPVDVVPVVRRMVEAMAPLAWESGRVEVVAELPETLPLAWMDESRLEQILANLLRNGTRHTPPGGIVAVMATAEEGGVRIEVRDTGEGIPPQELPHIWERFYRGENARTEDSRGAGLGLALVKELVEAMGGTVEVKSVVGKGSCFAVRVPRCET
jgi:signal transduction histidine kinase